MHEIVGDFAFKVFDEILTTGDGGVGDVESQIEKEGISVLFVDLFGSQFSEVVGSVVGFKGELRNGFLGEKVTPGTFGAVSGEVEAMSGRADG